MHFVRIPLLSLPPSYLLFILSVFFLPLHLVTMHPPPTFVLFLLCHSLPLSTPRFVTSSPPSSALVKYLCIPETTTIPAIMGCFDRRISRIGCAVYGPCYLSVSLVHSLGLFQTAFFSTSRIYLSPLTVVNFFFPLCVPVICPQFQQAGRGQISSCTSPYPIIVTFPHHPRSLSMRIAHVIHISIVISLLLPNVDTR